MTEPEERETFEPDDQNEQPPQEQEGPRTLRLLGSVTVTRQERE